ncbi:MAG: signal peptide peptidase SppA [Rikenellaceae bacterium]
MKFFKIFFAALLGCLVSGIIGFFLWVILLFSVSGLFNLEKSVTVSPNSILKISLEENFSEAPANYPFSSIDFSTFEMKPSHTLLNILMAIEAATEDDNIEGIYLCPNINPSIGTAALEEIRTALLRFKKSGKTIIAYSDTYSQGAYYVASVADKVYLQPEGMISWQGLASSTMFYKGLLDRLNISVDVFRPTACRYKSAVEPFIMSKMSNENRAQMQQLMDDLWNTIASDVALSRGLTLEQVNEAADNLVCMDADGALEARMIDELIYEDQLPAMFRETGAEINVNDAEVNYIDFADYVLASSLSYQRIGADKVAIIYAEGSIYDGQGTQGDIYSENTVEVIRRARHDAGIKAVVLRVNSPGGSALASDVIWRELELLRQEKPLIVSMGSYAASGGYYISAPADAIIANRLTLTGSIGVFGMVPNIEKGLSSKLGITLDGVKSNSSADFMTSLNGMSNFERGVMLKSVDKVYDRFTSLVSEGRNLPIENVLEIAQGRVWSGSEALELGLADMTGGLHNAISVAVDKANIEDNYRIVELSDEPIGIAVLFSDVQSSIKAIFTTEVDPLVLEYQQIREALAPLESKQGLVMYSPYTIEL